MCEKYKELFKGASRIKWCILTSISGKSTLILAMVKRTGFDHGSNTIIPNTECDAKHNQSLYYLQLQLQIS